MKIVGVIFKLLVIWVIASPNETFFKFSLSAIQFVCYFYLAVIIERRNH